MSVCNNYKLMCSFILSLLTVEFLFFVFIFFYWCWLFYISLEVVLPQPDPRGATETGETWLDDRYQLCRAASTSSALNSTWEGFSEPFLTNNRFQFIISYVLISSFDPQMGGNWCSGTPSLKQPEHHSLFIFTSRLRHLEDSWVVAGFSNFTFHRYVRHVNFPLRSIKLFLILIEAIPGSCRAPCLLCWCRLLLS